MFYEIPFKQVTGRIDTTKSLLYPWAPFNLWRKVNGQNENVISDTNLPATHTNLYYYTRRKFWLRKHGERVNTGNAGIANVGVVQVCEKLSKSYFGEICYPN